MLFIRQVSVNTYCFQACVTERIVSATLVAGNLDMKSDRVDAREVCREE